MTGAISKTIATMLMTGWIAAIPASGLAQTQPPAAQPPARAESALGARLSALERKIIDEYYRLKNRVTGADAQPQPGGEQPGRGMMTRSLPREPEPGAPLPVGLRKDPLPPDLQAKLPPASTGTERALVGDDVVLLDPRKNLVLDVMRGAATLKP